MTAPLNWLARYLPLRPRLEGARSLLEVGSGAVGLGCVTGAPFVGLDTAFEAAPTASMRAVQYQGARVPFADRSFGTVVSMDTLEHVAPADRAAFVRELGRVAAGRVLLGFPAGEEGRAADAALSRVFSGLGGAPAWLREHEAYGLPEEAEVAALLAGLEGFRVERLPAVGSLACLLFTLADVLGPLSAQVRALSGRGSHPEHCLGRSPRAKSRGEPPGPSTSLGTNGSGGAQEESQTPLSAADARALEGWIVAGAFGPAFRQVYLLERTEPSEGKVDSGDAASVARALECPGCGAAGRVSAEEARLTCAGCQATFAVDARGVWSLLASPRPVTFVMRPDWLGKDDWVLPVHNFLRAFTASDAPKLWLAVDRRALSAQDALALLQPVLARLGSAPFAELILSDDASEAPPAGRQVEVPGDRPSEAWTVAAFRQHAVGGAR